MNNSKITLAAARAERTMIYRRPVMYSLSYKGAYTKAQQHQNRKNNQKSQAQARRKTRDHLLCEIGGLWLKNFPESKHIDPYNEAQIAGIARAMVILAKDPWFAELWKQLAAQMKLGQQDNPIGPSES